MSDKYRARARIVRNARGTGWPPAAGIVAAGLGRSIWRKRAGRDCPGRSSCCCWHAVFFFFFTDDVSFTSRGEVGLDSRLLWAERRRMGTSHGRV